MRLEKGKLYELDGKPWRCVLVNECRAKLSPAWREERSFVEPDGTLRPFFFTPPGLDVSPHSALREWTTGKWLSLLPRGQ
ncbi:MAG: hypothetical protein ACREI9_04665 [Nitrospiraceae bacterium]